MDETRFAQITRQLGTDASRRRLLGGLIGAIAAALTGVTALEAKRNGKDKGRGKGRGNGRGHGRGRGGNGNNGKHRGPGTEKIQICHRGEEEETFHLIAVGAPARGAHERHDDVVCELEPCFIATGCNDDGTCIVEQAPEGTKCELDEEGTCDAAGVCVVDDDEDDDDEDDDDEDDDEDDGEDDEDDERGR